MERCDACGRRAEAVLHPRRFKVYVQGLRDAEAKDGHYQVVSVDEATQLVTLRSTDDGRLLHKCSFCLEQDHREAS